MSDITFDFRKAIERFNKYGSGIGFDYILDHLRKNAKVGILTTVSSDNHFCDVKATFGMQGITSSSSFLKRLAAVALHLNEPLALTGEYTVPLNFLVDKQPLKWVLFPIKLGDTTRAFVLLGGKNTPKAPSNNDVLAFLKFLLQQEDWAYTELISRKSGEVSNQQKLLEQLSIHKEELLTQNQELQEKQDELNTTRNYFEHLFEYSPIGYVLVSKYGEVLKVNRQIEKWFNIQEEDVQNREINFSKFLSLEEQSAYTKFLSNAFKSDVPIEAEFEVDRKDETWYFQIVALTLKFENAEPQVLLSITNVTQLFNLKQVAEQTKEKLEQLALVAKKTDNLVIITDRHGLIEWVNHGFLNETGFSSKEVLGKKPEDFLQGKDSDRKVIERLSKAIALGESIEVELINYRKDNTPYWVDISIQPIYNDRNLLEKFISIQKVITDKKRQEETLQRNIQLLEKTNQELDNFVYRVSHDLRAPISSVLGLIEISRLTDDWDTIYYYLDLQEQSMKKLDNFIRDILDYSRNARQKVKQEEIDIEGIINSIFEGLQFSDTTNLISKSIKIDGETAFYSDESRVKVILSNLISNGVKYAAPFRAESHINFSIKVDEQKMEIIYQDNGIGILKEHLPHIFEMFYRATDVNKGSGLGLYIVKETVNKLGGTISVSSPQGLGTQFTIVLPNELPKKAEYK